MGRKHWTADDMAEARRLYAIHGTFSAVARIMGRSKNTVNEQLNGLRGHRVVREVKDERIPPEVLADRDRRYELHHRDYTAAFFGDPLPGYSALEQR